MPERARTRCKGTLHPRLRGSMPQILMIWIILQLWWSVILWREQIIKMGFWNSGFYSFLRGRIEEGLLKWLCVPLSQFPCL